MGANAKGDPFVSPYVLRFSDATGEAAVSVEFDGTMPGNPLTGITVTRPDGCDLGCLSLNGHIKYPCGYGNTVITREQLWDVGLVLFNDIVSYTLDQVPV